MYLHSFILLPLIYIRYKQGWLPNASQFKILFSAAYECETLVIRIKIFNSVCPEAENVRQKKLCPFQRCQLSKNILFKHILKSENFSLEKCSSSLHDFEQALKILQTVASVRDRPSAVTLKIWESYKPLKNQNTHMLRRLQFRC